MSPAKFKASRLGLLPCTIPNVELVVPLKRNAVWRSNRAEPERSARHETHRLAAISCRSSSAGAPRPTGSCLRAGASLCPGLPSRCQSRLRQRRLRSSLQKLCRRRKRSRRRSHLPGISCLSRSAVPTGADLKSMKRLSATWFSTSARMSARVNSSSRFVSISPPPPASTNQPQPSPQGALQRSSEPVPGVIHSRLRALRKVPIFQ